MIDALISNKKARPEQPGVVVDGSVIKDQREGSALEGAGSIDQLLLKEVEEAIGGASARAFQL